MAIRSVVVSALAVCALLGCKGTSIQGTAHIVRGASTVPSGALRIGGAGTGLGADGHWLLSPDQAQLTVTKVELIDAAGKTAQVQLDNCAPTFKANAAELSTVLDCPFTITAEGTYVGLNVTVSNTAKVLISDATNGIFTDPNSSTGLSRTEPAGGAQLVTLTVNSNGNDGLTSELLFSQPLVVKQGETVAPTITLLADMIHTVFANLSGSSASFDTSLPLPPVSLLGTTEPITDGSVEYYAPSGSAADATIPLQSSGNETGSLRVFYTAPGQPAFVWHVVPGPSAAWAVDPAKSPASAGFRTGGYLGLDSTGTLCWALPTDFGYSSYVELCEMKVAAAVGDTTTIECQSMSSVPRPVSGDNYASGCPTITPDSSTQVTLVAR